MADDEEHDSLVMGTDSGPHFDDRININEEIEPQLD